MDDFGAIIWPMYVMLSQICGQGAMKVICDLTTSQAKILPDDIY
jgi:hypothetical protein